MQESSEGDLITNDGEQVPVFVRCRWCCHDYAMICISSAIVVYEGDVTWAGLAEGSVIAVCDDALEKALSAVRKPYISSTKGNKAGTTLRPNQYSFLSKLCFTPKAQARHGNR